MKKGWFAIVVLAVVASLVIAGCTSLTSNNQAATNTPQAATKTAGTAAKASSSETHIYQSTPTPSPSRNPSASQTSSGGGPANLKLLFFYKPDCPYCQALEPQVTQLQDTYAGKVSVQWVVSDQSPLTDQYGVTGVPTLILLNNGNEAGRWVDPGTTSAISAQISSLLSGG